MRRWDIAIAAGVHLAAVAATFALLRVLRRGDPAIAMIVGAAASTAVASYLYRRHAERMAGLTIKAKLGAALAALCLGESLIINMTWDGMADPYTTITMCVAGTFVFPFVLFHTMELIFVRRADPHYKYK